MQNLAGGCVPKDLPHSWELWMPIPGNIQIQAGQGSEHSDLIEDMLADCRRVGLGGLYRSIQPKPKPFWDSMVLLSQIVATLDVFFPATAPVPVALQLHEVKTSFDMFKQWVYCKQSVPTSLLMLQIRWF